MNAIMDLIWRNNNACFRPQQGLTIMNSLKLFIEFNNKDCFRPQQGLTIMNSDFGEALATNREVSVPNRG